MYGQMNLFDMFGGFDFLNDVNEPVIPENQNVKVKQMVLKNAEDYLKKGERITDLAKDIFSKRAVILEMSQYIKKLWKINYAELQCNLSQRAAAKQAFDLISKVSRSVTRPVLRNMEKAEESDPMFAVLQSFLPKGMTITVREYPDQIVIKRNMKEDEILAQFTFVEENQKTFQCMGMLRESHSGNAKNGYLRKNRDFIGDLGDLFSWLLIIKVVNEHLQEMKHGEGEMDEVGSLLYSYDLSKDVFADILAEFHYFRRFSVDGDLECLYEKTWVFPNEPSFKTWARVLSNHFHVNVEVENMTADELASKRRAVFNLSKEEKDRKKVPLYIAEIPTKVRKYFPCFIKEGLCDGFSYGMNTMGKCALPASVQYASETILKMFSIIAQEKKAEIKQSEFMKDLSGDYAKSFMTKKNIPKATQKAMEKSGFNDYFGYVEFDESVDLTLVEEILKEFVAVKETILNDVDSKDNAIRFRRLGNHKASGLYYPGVKCLCVDVGSPSSFIHEYGHLIDYCYGDLSLKQDFLAIRSLYTNILKANENSSKVSGKYNMDYYLMPTEVFARCFEMYMFQCREVKNSLLPQSYSWVYPIENKDLIKKVQKYYDSVLTRISNRELHK